MVSDVVPCPHCQQNDPVVRFGYNRCGTARCRCSVCGKTFTPQPKSRAVTPEKEQQILAALAERLSIDAVARLLHVSKNTVYATLKKLTNHRRLSRVCFA